jgi:hypothetical protein
MYLIPSTSRALGEAVSSQNEKPIQIRYMNDVTVLFLKKFSLFYTAESLSDKDKTDLRRYLDKMIEAKDAVSGGFLKL